MSGHSLSGCRVLHVNKLYHPDIGGVETVVRQYAQFLSELGADVTVLCCHGSQRRDETTQDGRVRILRTGTWARVASMPISPSFFRTYRRIRDQFDLIHIHEPFPAATLMEQRATASTRRVVTWHSDVVRQWYARPVLVPLQVRLCRVADRLTTTSPQLVAASPVLSRFKGKTDILPLSVDDEALRRLAVRTAGGQSALIGNDRPYVLYLGRLASYKGLGVLAQAAALVNWSGAQLVVAGEGSAPALESLSAQSPDAVTVINRRVTEEEKAALIGGSRCLVFPSTGDNEAFGVIQLEAMALGKPVINTRLNTGVPWVSADGISGITVMPGDAGELARAIERVLADPALRSRLGEGARERVRTMFSDAAAKPALGAIYSALLRV